MGKHDDGYARIPRDLFPTPPWPTQALCQHVAVAGRTVWELASGTDQMAVELRAAGARVYCTDIHDYGCQDEVFDFLSGRRPRLDHWDGAITNPPFGPRGKTAEGFIKVGLRLLPPGGLLALLLPLDFDSAITRHDLFGGCPHFRGKIVLLRRIVWFARMDGKREAPKENHAWFVWTNGPSDMLAWAHSEPVIRYASGRPSAVQRNDLFTASRSLQQQEARP
jgi:hypothetical protein